VLQNCAVPLLYASDMNDAVRQSAAHAQPGDAVLMSPACASFDMYRQLCARAERLLLPCARWKRRLHGPEQPEIIQCEALQYGSFNMNGPNIQAAEVRLRC